MSKILTTELQLFNLFLYLSHKYKVTNFYLNKLNKSKWTMYVHSIKNRNKFIISYYLPFLLNKSFNNATRVILHEFGHIKFNANTSTEREKLAEQYMLEIVKKDYPKLYQEAIEESKYFLNNKKWTKKFPNHYKAFSQIKDYQRKEN